MATYPTTTASSASTMNNTAYAYAYSPDSNTTHTQYHSAQDPRPSTTGNGVYQTHYHPDSFNSNSALGSMSATSLASSKLSSGVPPSSIPQHLSPLASLVRRASSRKFAARHNNVQSGGEGGEVQARAGAEGQSYAERRDASGSRTDLTSNANYHNNNRNGYDHNYSSNNNNIDTHGQQQQYDYNNYTHTTNDSNGTNVNTSQSNSNPIPRRLMANLRLDVDPPPGPLEQQQQRPPSPLLHSHFARASIATASSTSDDTRSRIRRDSQRSYASSSTSSAYSGREYGDDNSYTDEYGYFRGDNYADDASSVYSQSTQGAGPALRDSWNSTATGATIRRPELYSNNSAPMSNSQTVERRPSMPLRAVTAGTSYSNAVEVSAGHAGMQYAEGMTVQPQLPADMREQKRAVLERNLNAKRVSSAESVRTVRGVQSSSNLTVPQQQHARPPSRTYSVKSETPSTLMTPQEYLQQGIQHHEANRLGESARCFERSAIEGGGCGVGMLMYGLTLRHGWGCAKNEKMGFKWLMKAAEHAVSDLERLRTGGGQEAAGVVETELVLAIYEVGQCFFHGWGVAKDQKMAVSYYSVAARLGDGDAQADYAYCLANGKGCKKDKKEAALWYRKAIAQGQSDVGLAWIYKDKYS